MALQCNASFTRTFTVPIFVSGTFDLCDGIGVQLILLVKEFVTIDTMLKLEW